MKSGVELISEERQRQIIEEGYTKEHDSFHSPTEFVKAAIAYLVSCYDNEKGIDCWPWEETGFKPGSSKRNMVKAGALLAAALDLMKDEEN